MFIIYFVVFFLYNRRRNKECVMSNPSEIKQRIGFLLKEKQLSLNDVSLQLGKNGTYLFQFINRASPKRLGEFERKQLAKILGVDEQLLTDLPLGDILPLSDKANIDILDVKACCGSGNTEISEHVIGSWSMPNDMFKHISSTAPDNIKMIQVFGDSMQPTLKAGDWVLVDITHNAPDTDGLFVLWLATGLAVKRIQGGINNLIIHSDNHNYKDITAETGEIRIIGKVIYILKSERVG